MATGDFNLFLDKFSSNDFIMEPSIFTTLKKYFEIGGEPEKVIQLLSENYSGTAQKANILANWLLCSGIEYSTLQIFIEDILKNMIIKQFDPQIADKAFLRDEINILSWLPEMITHATWRSLIYKLSEQYSDCVFLNFAIKLISDAGFQNEITSISTASQQIEIFSKVLTIYITDMLSISNESQLIAKLKELIKLVCHGEHTYLYSICLFKELSHKYSSNLIFRRIIQEMQLYSHEHSLGSYAIDMAIDHTSSFPKLYTAITSMLTKKSLNPADITLIYNMYTSPEPPPAELLRNSLLIELLIDALFKPMSIVNPDHKYKYVFILAHAASVYEIFIDGKLVVKKDDLKPLIQVIEKANAICISNSSSTDIFCDLPTLFTLIRYPVIAFCIFVWLSHLLREPSYFINRLDSSWNGFHLALLDEIATCHASLHERILKLLVELFKFSFPDLEVLVQLELRKILLERMVHLVSRGYVMPVLEFISNCVSKQETDVSLIRHFVLEILEMISPPYQPEFISHFLPILHNKDITGSLINEERNDPVSTFINFCDVKNEITI